MPAQSAWTARRSALPWSEAGASSSRPETSDRDTPRVELNARVRRLIGGLRAPKTVESVPAMLAALNEALPEEHHIAHVAPEWRALEMRVMSPEAGQEDVAALYRLLRLVWLADLVFGDKVLGYYWLSEPKARLHGRTPLQVLYDPRQVGAIERWLVDIEEGNEP